MKPGTQHQPESRIASLNSDNTIVNLTGDYTYLCEGYYRSQDLEADGENVYPTCVEILDAYIVPICLEKAKQAGVPVPEHYITNDYFDPPVMLDPINPFMDQQRLVLKPGTQERAARSLTRNFTYAVCCQELPPGTRVSHFHAVLGWSSSPRFRTMATLIWDVFHIPLANVRVFVRNGETVLLSRLKPLPFERLTAREHEYVSRRVTWQT